MHLNFWSLGKESREAYIDAQKLRGSDQHTLSSHITMVKFHILLLLVTATTSAFATTAHSIENEQAYSKWTPLTASRIVGGTFAPRNIAQTQAIISTAFASPFQLGSCGASILSARYVLTAAHCVLRSGRDSPFSVLIFFGKTAVFAGTPVTAERVFTHRKFAVTNVNGFEGYIHDVAVIKLKRPLPKGSFNPIRLAASATDMPPLRSIVTAVGFGKTAFEGSSFPDMLRKVSLRYQPYGLCFKEENAKFKPLLDNRVVICATHPQFPKKGGRDSCTGDSGGSLYWTRKGAFIQIGIVSWGSNGCAVAGVPSWYTRVTTYKAEISRLVRGDTSSKVWHMNVML